MKIKTLFTIAAGICGFLALLVILSFVNIIKSYGEFEAALTYQINAVNLANEMTQSSEDLTRDIRMYAMTCNKIHRDSYNQVLAVRNGQAADEFGEKKAFSTKVSEMHLTSEESAYMSQSEKLSNSLATMEMQVMQYIDNYLVEHPDADNDTFDEALFRQQSALYSAEYMNQVAAIMKPVSSFKRAFLTRAHKSAQANKASASMSIAIGLVTLMIFIIFAVGMFILSPKSFLNPLAIFNTALGNLAKGDFTVTLPPKITNGNNEMAVMAKNFSKMTREVGTMVQTVQSTVQEVETNCEDLTSNIEETTSQVRSIEGHIEAISTKAQTQSMSVSTVSSSVEEITKNIEALDGIIVNQSNAVDKSSNGIKGMIAGIETTQENINKIVELFESLVAASKAGTEKQSLVEKQVQNVVGFSNTLNETNKVIGNIASQTNLLAMNAAIESAHAGDAGRGFAVVAGEIRKLAESSSVQSDSIGRQLEEIQGGIQSIVVSSDESRKSFDTIASQIDTLNELVANIREEITRQSEDAAVILHDIENITQVTEQVKGGSEEMQIGAQTILSEVMNLQSATDEVQGNISNATESVKEIEQYSANVLKETSKTREGIGVVDTKISTFKV